MGSSAEIHCQQAYGDVIRLVTNEGGDADFFFEASGANVYARTDEVRRFAHDILRQIGEPAPGAEMTRSEALETATKRVAELATNQRGYADGASFEARCRAVLATAAFLLGEGGNPDA